MDTHLLPKKLIICVTFHYNEERLQYLRRISQHFGELAADVIVYIVTNTEDQDQLKAINSAVDQTQGSVSIASPRLLGHPYLLPWSHFAIVRQLFDDRSISHFMYLEDDILVRKENIAYWCEGREKLRQLDFIPSFLRVEHKHDDPTWYSTDVTQRSNFLELSGVQFADDYTFVNLRQPYQGMYLLDRELMSEHLSGPSSSPEFGNWGIREKAAQGLTFANVRQGFVSRNLLGYSLAGRQIDSRSLIHHTPNNYANDPASVFGKIPIDQLIIFDLGRNAS